MEVIDTEDKAKDKWCPMAGNRNPEIPEDILSRQLRVSESCIGSACMMFRWSSVSTPAQLYCGLGGRP